MSPTVRVKVELNLDDQPLNRGHCPIANTLRRADPDILSPRVDRDRISFSRRSTNTRYTYTAPRNAKAFIDAIDNGETPAAFLLHLTDRDLINEHERRQRDPDEYPIPRTTVPQPGGRNPSGPTLLRPRVTEE